MDQQASATAMRRPTADIDELMLAVAAGEGGALRAIYERTSAKLYGICLRVLGDEGEAQDALQEVFTKYNPKDQHGKTSHLSAAQIDDLAEFLRALPYEDPEPEAKKLGMKKVER